MSEREKLIVRSYSTYKSRLRAFQRLQHRATVWETTLIVTNATLLILTTFLVIYPDSATLNKNSLMIFLSFVALVVSLFVAVVNYQRRANEMFRNYRALQRFSSNLEARIAEGQSVDIVEANERYQDILDFTENHTESDFESMIKEKGVNESDQTNPYNRGSYYAYIKSIKTFMLDWGIPALFWLVIGFLACYILLG